MRNKTISTNTNDDKDNDEIMMIQQKNEINSSFDGPTIFRQQQQRQQQQRQRRRRKRRQQLPLLHHYQRLLFLIIMTLISLQPPQTAEARQFTTIKTPLKIILFQHHHHHHHHRVSDLQRNQKQHMYHKRSLQRFSTNEDHLSLLLRSEMRGGASVVHDGDDDDDGGDDGGDEEEEEEIVTRKKKKKGRSNKNTNNNTTTKTIKMKQTIHQQLVQDNKNKKTTKRKIDQQLLQQQKQKQKQQQQNHLPLVESVLVPRSAICNLRQWIAALSLSAAFLSLFLGCIPTAGQPYRHAVWEAMLQQKQQLQQQQQQQSADTPDSITHEKMPSDYKPSVWDLLMIQQQQQQQQQQHKVHLPPQYLPSPKPLLSLILSLVFYIFGTILLPRWNLHAHTFLNYQSIPTTNKKAVLSSLTEFSSKPLSVLIRVPKESRMTEHQGKSHIVCPLFKTTDNDNTNDNTGRYYFDMHRVRYYWDPNTDTITHGGPRLHLDWTIDRIHSWSGLDTPKRLLTAKQTYEPYNSVFVNTNNGRSDVAMAGPSSSSSSSSLIPTIRQAFLTRLSSPLSVSQLLGTLLLLVEKGGHVGTLIQIVSSVFEHYWNARKTILSAKELASEVTQQIQNTSQLKVRAVRSKITDPTAKKKSKKQKDRNKNKKHETSLQTISAIELLPGDVFWIDAELTANLKNGGNSSATTITSFTMPVDAVLLDISASSSSGCIAMEAVLTGESVPQPKVPLEKKKNTDEAASSSSTTTLDMQSEHRSSVLFAGTTIQLSGRDARIRCLAMKTGSYSSRGDLWRALQKQRVGVITNEQTERDGLTLILTLSVASAVSCIWYLLQANNNGHDTSATATTTTTKTILSPFRKVLQCTRIAMTSIPSDLPIALSNIAQVCSRRLKHDSDVVCGEPGSLLTASQIDCVVFDKTGTLTADTQSLSKLVFVEENGKPSKKKKKTTTKTKNNNNNKKGALEKQASLLLAGCHSLIPPELAGGQWMGDPLDKASFQYTGWKYCADDDSFMSPTTKNNKNTKKQNQKATKVWQIKTFPFDPNRKLSSALLLVKNKNDGTYSLIQTVKGSPETIQTLIRERSSKPLLKWYSSELKKLGRDGFRTISMATVDLGPDSEISTDLFPDGLPSSNTTNPSVFVQQARQRAKRSNVVDRDGVESNSLRWKFLGFACFDASIRPSTPRVLSELRTAGGIQTIMLTGDGMDAAVSVAERSGILPPANTHTALTILGTHLNGTLVWQDMDNNIGTDFSFSRSILSKPSGLAMTGDAAEKLLTLEGQEVADFVLSQLSRFAIFARCSPGQKKKIVGALREHCQRSVLMCGDGVNDVAAMKEADCGLALLNGYGDEAGNQQNDVDFEDQRRLQRLRERRIGSSRRNKVDDKSTLAGIGNTPRANRIRVQSEFQSATMDIRIQAAKRQGLSDPNDPRVQVTFADAKSMFSAIAEIRKKERLRATLLRKGGAGAARILAEEEAESRSESGHRENATSVSGEVSAIQAGEVSLVSSFSCLRPSIDGVDALLRTGVATAACALSTMQNIGLQNLMGCYNLACLFKDGFRYGNNMWNVESALSMVSNQAAYQASCSPRPRLSKYRVQPSLFHPSNILIVCAQAFIHLTTLSFGVRIGKLFEECEKPSTESLPRLIKLSNPSPMAQRTVSEELVGALLGAPVQDREEAKEKGFWNVFQRPPFEPNYPTNIVFLLSIFQNAVSQLVNHKGKPYYGSILESRQLTASLGLSFLFPIMMTMNSIPRVCQMLKIKPFLSRKTRLPVLILFVLDFVGCVLASFLTSKMTDNTVQITYPKHLDPQRSLAVDEEEKLLEEEEKENIRIALILAISALFFVVKGLM